MNQSKRAVVLLLIGFFSVALESIAIAQDRSVISIALGIKDRMACQMRIQSIRVQTWS